MTSALNLALRDALSILPKIGVVKKPATQKDGITFIVAAKDEGQWIEPCLLSIEPVADEIIVVDSSVEDETGRIVSSLAQKYDKIKHIVFRWEGSNAFALSLHIGLVSAQHHWVFKWDADYVGKSTEALMEWKKRLDSLDKDKYYVIDLSRVELVGNLQHQPKNFPSFGFFYDTRILTWSPELKWALKKNYFEQPCGDSIWGHRLPPWYKILRWTEPYIFHCNIKSPMRTLTRLFWVDYMKDCGGGFKSLEDYTVHRVRADWGMSLEQGLKKISTDLEKDLQPYDRSRFGDLPELLTKNRA